MLGHSWTRSSHATHIAVPIDRSVRKPPQLGWEVAGALFIVELLAARRVRVLGIASPASAGWLSSHGAVPVAYGDGLRERLLDASGIAATYPLDAVADLERRRTRGGKIVLIP